MLITDLKVNSLSVPLETPQRASFGSMTSRNTTIIEIMTNENITGIGESWINFPSWGWKERKATFEEGIKPLLIGKNPLKINTINKMLKEELLRVGVQWGARGIIYQAISAVDIALWDILGKTLDSPVYCLFGEGNADPVPIYASGIELSNASDIIERWLKKGVKAFKFKVGLSEKAREIELLNKIGTNLPTKAKMMIDGTQRWNVEEAINFLEQLKDINLTWVEEPISTDNYSGMRQIYDKTTIPVAVGENIYGLEKFRSLLESKAAKVIQPDLTKTGGFSEVRDIIALKKSWNIDFAPHVYGSAVGLVAALHIMTAYSGIFLEVDCTENSLQTEIFKKPVPIENGCMLAPKKPGLGIELDSKFIKEYSV